MECRSTGGRTEEGEGGGEFHACFALTNKHLPSKSDVVAAISPTLVLGYVTFRACLTDSSNESNERLVCLWSAKGLILVRPLAFSNSM